MRLGSAQRSPTGLMLWPIVGAEGASVIWLGPGAGLFLGLNATDPEGQMVRIEHRTADGTYDTPLEASRAAHAFVEGDDR
jgi:hypothetical protein